MTNSRSTLAYHLRGAGYPLPPSSVIHLFAGGSNLHGAKVHGQADLDIYGCYIDPPSNILGIKTMEHFVTSSDKQNKSGDVDVKMYSLHNWAKMIMKGDSGVFQYLYAERDRSCMAPRVWDAHILPIREYLVTKKVARQYLGFANSQRLRLTGEKGLGRHGQRLDLVQKYGFDTKFAMHYVRLLGECKQLLTERQLTFPRPDKAILIDIRQGKHTLNEVFEMGTILNRQCEELLETSILPDVPDVNILSEAVARAYRAHWACNEATC